MDEQVKDVLNLAIDILCIARKLGEKETGENADYSDIITELRWNKVMLNNRLVDLNERDN